MSDQWVMGALAAQDQYRPLGNDPWTNTMAGTAPAPGQGFAPVQQSPVLYNTKAGPITEADIGTATEAALGVSGGGLSTKGIKAYHSSPHDFDRFDLSKIGSGEGAQVYGHGLYFAENPAVSGQGGQYWNQFLNRFEGYEGNAARTLQRAGFDREAALKASQRDIDQLLTNYGDKLGVDPRYDVALERMRKEHALLTDKQPVGPRTYEVNINADPAHMLDWDKPLKRQSPEVVEGLQKAMNPRQWKEFNVSDASTAMKQGFIGSDMRTASEKIAEAGIPGIKYLDEGSRGVSPYNIIPTGHGNYIVRGQRYSKLEDAQQAKAVADAAYETERTRNYVVFDPSIVDIMKKYGLAGATTGTMGALAAQDSYQPQERM